MELTLSILSQHVNREKENLTQNLKVQEYLEKAKVARRPIIRYIQLVNDEEFVGTLLEANEKIVEAIQLYDKLSKPAALDSDDEHEDSQPKGREPTEREMDALRRRMEAQKLEADRTGEMYRLQEKQKKESQRAKERRAAGQRPSRYYEEEEDYRPARTGSQLPAPLVPDTHNEDDRHR